MRIFKDVYHSLTIDGCLRVYEEKGESTICHGDEMGVSIPEEIED